MAYADTNSNTRRTATAIAVAILQAGAIYAVVTGLAVNFIDRPKPERRTEGVPIPITPIPKPEASQAPRPPLPVPPTDIRDPISRPTDPLPGPTTDPSGTAGGTGTIGGIGDSDVTIVEPPIDPLPTYAPRQPRPLNPPAGWATANDYPARDLREGNQGVTRFRLSVGANGKVLGCEIVVSSGFPGLDRTTCDKVTRRARFEAATDRYGEKVSDTYGNAIRWQIPD